MIRAINSRHHSREEIPVRARWVRMEDLHEGECSEVTLEGAAMDECHPNRDSRV